MMRSLRGSVAIAALAVLAPAGQALGGSAPDGGRAFEPPPLPPAVYEIAPPPAPDRPDPNHQVRVVRAEDGTDLYVETWLPQAAGGAVLGREPLPSVIYFSPYEQPVRVYPENGQFGRVMRALVTRGYAVSRAHVRGTGASGGCLEQVSRREADDAARVIEYVGEQAPWRSRRVGLLGLSYGAGTAFAAAGRGERDRTESLRALVLVAPYVSAYDYMQRDGVPGQVDEPLLQLQLAEYGVFPNQATIVDFFASDPAGMPERAPAYLAARTGPEGVARPTHVLERGGCRPEAAREGVTLDGNYTDWFADREGRRWADQITAPTLMFHGHRDQLAPPINQRGTFDRLPHRTPKAGVFGVFDHHMPDVAFPDQPNVDWRRSDAVPMTVAWFERWLRGVRNRAERWPVAQVQGSDGQWRAEPGWPTTGGPPGQLALGPSGSLGTTAPTGSSGFDAGWDAQTPGGQSVSWTTPPLPERLELTGMPVLDVWLTSDKDDAHIAVRVEAFDAGGNPLLPEDQPIRGWRSIQHLDPMPRGYFEQRTPHRVEVGVPVRVPVRLDATDVVVPSGGRLRVSVAGAFDFTEQDPSLAFPHVTILHDCEHVSVLRFLMPRREPDLLNVREIDEPSDQPLPSNPVPSPPVSDGGGVATAPVCGLAPSRTAELGPRRSAPRNRKIAQRTRR